MKRMVGLLLQEIDGLESLGDVMIVAATNRPHAVDEVRIVSVM